MSGLGGCDLTIKIGDCLFQHLTQARVVGRLQLLQHALARESKSFLLSDEDRLFGRDPRARRLLLQSSFRLLFFNRLTFPSARHAVIIRGDDRKHESCRVWASNGPRG
jgi:hypothetical protein